MPKLNYEKQNFRDQTKNRNDRLGKIRRFVRNHFLPDSRLYTLYHVAILIIGGEMKVLIVDDNFHSRRFLQYLLMQLGHEIYTAENGIVGLKLMKQFNYDLIILDWNMPEMNGRETINAYDQMLLAPTTTHADVIIYSTFPLTHMKLPEPRHVRIRNYISKNSSPSKQLSFFKKSISHLRGT